MPSVYDLMDVARHSNTSAYDVLTNGTSAANLFARSCCSKGMDAASAVTSSALAVATTSLANGTSTVRDGRGRMRGGTGKPCKISMLFNYDTIDACFFTKNWQISHQGQFASTCLGAFALCLLLEFLRRISQEFDKLLVKRHSWKHRHIKLKPLNRAQEQAAESQRRVPSPADAIPPLKLNWWQQAIRAVLHTGQFTVAYFIMLLGKADHLRIW